MMPKNRPPTSPGEILEEEFIKPLGMTQTALAKKLGVHVQVVNLIVQGRRAITAPMALKLSDVLGTTPEFWLGLQMGLDLWTAQQERERRGHRATHGAQRRSG